MKLNLDTRLMASNSVNHLKIRSCKYNYAPVKTVVPTDSYVPKKGPNMFQKIIKFFKALYNANKPL